MFYLIAVILPPIDILMASYDPQPLNTPGWPDNYPAKLTHESTVHAPEGQQVQYVLVQGKTEQCCDKVEVRNLKMFYSVKRKL